MATVKKISEIKDLFSRVSSPAKFELSFVCPDNLLVYAGLTSIDEKNISLLCQDVQLPGSSFATLEKLGDRQGVREIFAQQRVFDPIQCNFIVDSNHKVLKLFNDWLNSIQPLSGDVNEGITNNYMKFRYPKTYWAKSLKVIKFEKDYRLTSDKPSSETTYNFINAWPTKIDASPVSYNAMDQLLYCSVTFAYNRFYIT